MAFIAAKADNDNFFSQAGFANSQCLFQCDLIERVDAHLDAVGLNTAAIRLDPDADVVVNDAFYANQYFHGNSFVFNLCLEILVIRSTATLGCDPVNNLVRILDVAGFAVNAICSVDLQALTCG